MKLKSFIYFFTVRISSKTSVQFNLAAILQHVAMKYVPKKWLICIADKILIYFKIRAWLALATYLNRAS
jgi:hypothetical protein